MKKLLVVLASVVFATGLFAREAGDTQVTVFGAVGIGLTSGGSKDDAKTGIAVPFSFGAQFGYFINDTFALVVGGAYTRHPLKLVDENDSSVGFKITQSFFDINPGVRSYLSDFFLGAGFTYGIKVGDRVMYAIMDDKEHKLGAWPDSYSKNNATIYLEGGWVIPVSDDMTFDLGLKCNLGLANVMKQGPVQLKAHSFLLTAGLSFLF